MRELPESLQACAGGLTVKWPWTDAILYDSKRIENRSWKPPKKVIGERIAIQQAKSDDERFKRIKVEVAS